MRLTAILTSAILIVWTLSTVQAASIYGRVTDTAGTAIVGASVIVRADSAYHNGSLTDMNGCFSLAVTDGTADLQVRISSLGYAEKEIEVQPGRDERDSLHVMLTEKTIDFAAVQVSGARSEKSKRNILTRNEIARAARYSIVPTNPISAIIQPEVIRAGSQHSSKLRVLGSSPDYYLNDISIGQDPNHYGVFTMIPGSVIDRMTLRASGTPARYGQSSVLEIHTAKRFERHTSGSVNLSFVEATGAASYGTDRMFLIGSLRKSVLDKLIDQFDIKSGRRTIPPTNFQDVFLSAGYQLSPSLYLISDQFHARDYLTYTTDPSANNPDGVFTYQHARDNYFGLRLEAYYPASSFSIRLAGNIKSEEYLAHSGIEASSGGLQVDLDAYQRRIIGGADVRTEYTGIALSAGLSGEYIPRRLISLSQRNWNFQPPDATSDNPHLFQAALNELYDVYYNWDEERNGAGYVSAEKKIKNVVSVTGIRIDYFGNLKNKTAVSVRQSLAYPLTGQDEVNVFVGTFAENPAGRILEAYQVLVHANLPALYPVRSAMASLKYRHRNLEFSVYAKNAWHLPALIPDYSRVDKSGDIGEDFVTVQSSGRRRFFGGSVSLTADSLADGNLDMYGYYSYTRARKTVSEVTVPYELNSPHVLYISGSYRTGRKIHLGLDFTWRSGYAYTPAYTDNAMLSRSVYSQEYYEDALEAVNSNRFPDYIMLNIKGTYRFGRTELFASIANLLNRSNPIINTYDGFVYDAGILPSVGIVHSF